MLDAEAILAEYRRPQDSGRRIERAGLGRRLDGGNVSANPSQIPTAASSAHDTDAAMKWMESRIDALAAEVAAENKPSALQSARRGGRGKMVTPRIRGDHPGGTASAAPASDGHIAELMQLEAKSRAVASRLRTERRAVELLREQLQRAGLEQDGDVLVTVVDGNVGAARQESALDQRRVGPSGGAGGIACGGGASGGHSARAVIAVRPSQAGATSASDLSDATARRAASLQRQIPTMEADLDATVRERAQLEELVRRHLGDGAVAEATSAAAAAGGAHGARNGPAAGAGGMPEPAALFAQLERLDRAARTALPASTARGAGVHTLGGGGPPIVPVTVFADGFMLYRGPFRPLVRGGSGSTGGGASGTNELFVTQVMAGMLPHELQQRYPDGFAFELHDRSQMTHAQAHEEALRKSAGGGSRIAGVADVTDGAAALLAPRGADQLLRNLPSSVVRDGNLVPVRSDVAEILGAAGGVASRSARPQQPSNAGADDLAAMRAARLRRFNLDTT